MADDKEGGDGARPTSGKAERIRERRSGAAAATEDALLRGDLLGSDLTDTLGAELCYGADGRTDLMFFGETFIFAPVGMDDHDAAAADLNQIPTPLLALGMTRPFSPLREVDPADVAKMQTLLMGGREMSELQSSVNLTMLVFNMTSEEKAAFCRLMWYGFRRWQPDIELEKVRRFFDFSNSGALMRLWFRKNLGFLERFMQRLVDLLPRVQEVNAEDLRAQEPLTAEAIANLASAVNPDDAPPPAEEEPPTLEGSPGEVAAKVVAMAAETTPRA